MFSYWTVSYPTPEDEVFARKVILEYSVDGIEWLKCHFVEKEGFITWISFGWDLDSAQYYADGRELQWRAVVID